MAKLHGYTTFGEDDTEESLKAAILRTAGEAYRSQEEEQADNRQAALDQRSERIAAQLREERDALRVAKANGFMNCREIRDALGYDQPNPGTGEPYSSMQVAYRWIGDADEEVVYPLEEDGRRITSLTYRSGCWATDFPAILEAKNEYYAEIADREKRSWDDSRTAKDAFEKQKADELLDLIVRQNAASAQRIAERTKRYAEIDAARDAEIQRLIAEAEADDEQVIPDARRDSIIAALRSYAGPLTRTGCPIAGR